MECIAYIGLSLDGFIARPDGSLDWMEIPNTDPDEDFGFKDFMSSIDEILMGRTTYNTVLSFDDWIYGDTMVNVYTSKPLDAPEAPGRRTRAVSGTPKSLLTDFRARGLSRVYVDGGQTIQTFLEAGLLNRLILTRLPVLLGKGIPLFGTLEKDIAVRHAGTRSFPGGLVQSEYTLADCAA